MGRLRRLLLTPPSPVLDLDFSRSQTLDSRVSFSRATSGARYDAAGTYEVLAADQPRFDFDPVTLAARGLLVEPQRTNLITNNTAVDAVVGSPGVLPLTWSGLSPAQGNTVSVVAFNATEGSIDLRFSGTPSSSSSNKRLILLLSTAASVGQTYSSSMTVSLIAGSLANLVNMKLNIQAFNSLAALVQTLNGSNFVPTATPQRASVIASITASDTASIITSLSLSVTSGQAIDFTLRITRPQLELGNFYTSQILTSGTAVTREADFATIESPVRADILVQDLEGGGWIENVAAGAYQMAARSGYRHLRRWGAYPAGTAARFRGLARASL